MRQFWFKIYCPESDETRIFWMDIPHHEEGGVYEHLKREVKYVFSLSDDYDFYFTHIDKDNDQVSIKENYEILNYMCRMENNDKLKLSVTPINQEKKSINDADSSSDNSSAALTESFQSIIKNLELGFSNLQATVEKSAVTVSAKTVDTVVRTAAETAAHVYRSMLPPATLSEKPQFDVICDGCYTPIRGQRWRCETCEDFDLCSVCKSRVIHDKKHNFRSIKNVPQHTQPDVIVPDKMNTESNESKSLQTIFICDYCDSDIVGIRHTCGACPDFDLCHSCFAIVKENHPEHIFVTRLVGTQTNSLCKQPYKKTKAPISPRESYDPKEPIIYHRGVECDNCQEDITGVRYKCGHCVNYDLCETCEQYSLSIHDKSHAFIKIRYPIQSIIKKAILPKFIPLGEGFENTPSSSTIEKSREMTMMSSKKSNDNDSILNIPTPSGLTTPTNVPVTTAPIKSTLSLPPVEPILSASFVSDINIPDGTLIVPKKTFIKMWKIANNGTVDWPIGTHLLFTGGSILRPYPVSRPDSFVVPVVSPNEKTCITAELQAPDCAGDYTSYFCLCTPDGTRFGDLLWCNIKVDQDNEPENLTRTVSASDIMMNSSNSMIFPTISTSSSVAQINEEAQSNDGYTDQDGYSVSTNDHISIENSNNSYASSHVSSPASSEIDISERHCENFFSEEESQGNEEVLSTTPESQIVNTSEMTLVHEYTEEDGDDDFIFIDSQEENSSSRNSNNNSLASSIQSSRTITPKSDVIPDEVIYRSQLLKLHEMGFTSCDDLAITLLKANQGRVDDVIAKLLYYP